jgi:hypothetical protein
MNKYVSSLSYCLRFEDGTSVQMILENRSFLKMEQDLFFVELEV